MVLSFHFPSFSQFPTSLFHALPLFFTTICFYYLFFCFSILILCFLLVLCFFFSRHFSSFLCFFLSFPLSFANHLLLPSSPSLHIFLYHLSQQINFLLFSIQRFATSLSSSFLSILISSHFSCMYMGHLTHSITFLPFLSAFFFSLFIHLFVFFNTVLRRTPPTSSISSFHFTSSLHQVSFLPLTSSLTLMFFFNSITFSMCFFDLY